MHWDFCGCRKMPDCFGEVNMYQRASQIEYCQKKKDTTEKKQRERKEKCNWDVHKSAIWQKWLNK